MVEPARYGNHEAQVGLHEFVLGTLDDAGFLGDAGGELVEGLGRCAESKALDRALHAGSAAQTL